MSSCYGYGAVIEKSDVRESAYEEMRKKLVESDWDIKRDYLEFLEDENREDCSSSFEHWIKSVYENETYLWSGFEGFLVDYINHVEFNDETILRYEDYCIYVAATLPSNEEERAKIPTTEQIRSIIEKYVNPYYVEPKTCSWETIELD